MNPKALFVILLIALIIYMGISQKQAVCNPPYIPHGNECCIDSNQDAVCDTDQPEAFVTTLSETTTTLDPCISLSGYNKTACLFEKDKRRYADDCVESCDNASSACRPACEQKELAKEKIACLETCFKEYSLCYSECGAIAPLASPAEKAGANETKKKATALNITNMF
jgi:hypothetical protein